MLDLVSRNDDSSDVSDNVFSSVSPVDGEPLASIEATAAEAVGEAIARARAASVEWAALPLIDRIDAIAKVKRAILSRAQEIAELVHREVGKPVEEAALAEVLPNADLVDYWCDSIEELLDVNVVELDPISYPGKLGQVQRDPRGVVALITPWNYPVAIPLRTLIPALLAGNSVVFKPSEVTPRAGALVASLFEGILPEGVLQVVQGGADVGKALVGGDVDLVVFTGSVATGKAIAVSCAERLIPCSLELGGKDAAIVLDDCRLERTAQGIVWGAFTNAGQNCSAVERVYVVAEVADKLIERIVAISKELGKGDLAVVTTGEQRDKVVEHIDGALQAGAELLLGGKPDDATTLALEPTIVKVDDDSAACPAMVDETFGPLLAIMVVKDADEAVERVNASRYGLTTSVWTQKIARGRALAARLNSGVVTINNHSFSAALPAAPWTGTGDTGYGVTNSPHCLSSLTRVRFLLEDRNRAKRELWWYPYTPVLRTIALSMAAVRGGAGFFGRIAAFFRLLPAIFKRLVLGG